MNAVEVAFQPVLGLPCWSVHHGYGSFLTMEFGEPHLEIHELRQGEQNAPGRGIRRSRTRRLAYARGDWHLWIFCCHWFVFDNGRRIGNSNNNRAIQRAVKLLSGQKLVSVTVNQLPGRSTFEFDLGARLTTRPYDRKPQDKMSDQWYLYEPSGTVLSFRGDGWYSHKPRDTPSDEEEWHELAETTPAIPAR